MLWKLFKYVTQQNFPLFSSEKIACISTHTADAIICNTRMVDGHFSISMNCVRFKIYRKQIVDFLHEFVFTYIIDGMFASYCFFQNLSEKFVCIVLKTRLKHFNNRDWRASSRTSLLYLHIIKKALASVSQRLTWKCLQMEQR